MIIKRFHSPFAYLLVKIIFVFVIFLFSFIPSGILLQIFDINFTIINLILMALVITFVFIIFPFLGLLLGLQSKELYKNISNKTNLALLPNEKILSKSRLCLIKGISSMGYSIFPRTVIVTNFRITLGFLNTLSFFSKGKMEEKMGFMNLWNSNIKKIPEVKSEASGFKSNSGLMNFLGANTKIKDIAYGANSKGDFIIVRIAGDLVYFKFNHPDAKLIYNSFKI